MENSFLPNLGGSSYTSFGGETVSINSVLIRYTKGADCNLDGKVNGDDLTILNADLNAGGTGEWYLADFDYDGICDGDDATMMGALYDPTAPPLNGSNAMMGQGELEGGAEMPWDGTDAAPVMNYVASLGNLDLTTAFWEGYRTQFGL